MGIEQWRVYSGTPFKVYLRGVARSTISYIKRTNRREEEELIELCAQAEADIKDPLNINQIRWAELMRQYKNQLIVNAKCKRFQLKQKPLSKDANPIRCSFI